jgi:hypothetical protein
MKAYFGSGGIAPRILYLGTRLRWMVSFTPRSLYPQRKSSWYPLDRRLGGPQSRSGRGGEEKNSQPLPGLELPIIRPVAQRYITELSRLRCIIYAVDKLVLNNLRNSAVCTKCWSRSIKSTRRLHLYKDYTHFHLFCATVSDWRDNANAVRSDCVRN